MLASLSFHVSLNRLDRIRNYDMKKSWGSTYRRKMVETRHRWFGHVGRRPVDSLVRRVEQMEVVKSLKVKEDLEKL
jgi:nonsense-mediated mRNA decay protein 3